MPLPRVPARRPPSRHAAPVPARLMLPDSYRITPVAGYTPLVGRMVSMLTHARSTTLHAVRELSTEQLDHRHDARSNSIGMLLAHIATVEDVYRIITFERREPTPGERARWGAAVDLGPDAWRTIRERPLSSYLDEMEAVRGRTLQRFRDVDDGWLDELNVLATGASFNRHWQWFHVMEDELSHRGQIRWLRARLPA